MFRKLFVAVFLTLISVSAAHAQWTSVVTDTFTRANTTPCSGAGCTTAGAGVPTSGSSSPWVDAVGGVYSINSNKLVGTQTAQSFAISTDQLVRPSTEYTSGQRVVITFVWSASTNAQVSAILRYNIVAVPSQPSWAVVLLDGTTIQGIHANSLGGSGGIGSSATLATALVSGHTYTLDVYASAASSPSINATVTDVTTTGVVGTWSATVTSGDIYATGSVGVGFSPWNTSGGETLSITQIQTFSGTPSSGSLVLSPSSVPANATGRVITVTGTGTNFTGTATPFSISGGLGAFQTGQAQSSTTAGTITINTGLTGHGTVLFSDSSDGLTAPITITSPALGTYNGCWIGDSITAGYLDTGTPVVQARAVLTTTGYTGSDTNRGISGTTTNDWLPGGTYLAAAVTACKAVPTNFTHIMLGTNDAKVGGYTAAQHYANMAQIVNYLTAQGMCPCFISHAPFTVPNANAGVWPGDPNALYNQYWTLDKQLMNGTTVFEGDSSMFAQSQQSPTTLLNADGIHPSSTGYPLIGSLWGVAISYQSGNALVSPWTHY